MGPLLFVCIGFLVGIWCFSGKYGATIFIAIVLFIALIWSHFYDFPAPEPNVIGTGTVQYDGKSATYFVVIDSAQYRINGIEQRSQPFLSEEMVVTVYTLPFEKEHYTIEGEKLYKTLCSFLLKVHVPVLY